MKRTAVIFGIAITALVAPGAASATGVIPSGISTSPGSLHPQSGIIGQGFGSSPSSVRPLTGVIVNGVSTSPGSVRPGAGVIGQGFGTSPHAGIVVQRFRMPRLPVAGILQQ
jgi:hypothetical protein